MNTQGKENGKTKALKTKAYNYFCTPALIIHELLHYIMIKLTFAKYGRVNVILAEDYDQTGNLSVAIFYVPSNKFQTFMISMAPFLAIAISPLLFAFGFNTLALLYAVYTVLCARVVLPSKEDFDAIKGDQEAFV
jgi:hypothetical protein